MLDNPKIQAVIFDLGNVLVRIDHRDSLKQLTKASGLSEQEVFRGVNQGNSHILYETGMMNTEDFVRGFETSLGMKVDSQKLVKIFQGILKEQILDDAFLLKIKKRYPIHILSNTNPIHYGYFLENYPIVRHFEKKFLSYELKCMKPYALIYEKVIKDLNLPPRSLVFVDDSKENAEAANEAGMNGIVFTGKEKLLWDLKLLGIEL